MRRDTSHPIWNPSHTAIQSCQDMQKLNEKLSLREYNKFVNESYFMIHRLGQFWARVWLDITIEVAFKSSLSSQGGMTHGRVVPYSTTD